MSNMANTRNVTADISSKEFQRQLFDWFEKRGLLSELRTFMRHRMISALYSNDAPCPGLRFSSDTSVSPTLQALLLLIVEFLVKQEYHYTMSIFVAEAPLIASFPKFSGYVSYMPQYDTLKSGSEFPRYTEKDVQDIMEVFGISAGSEGMDHILRLYFNNNAREPLLVCALTALSAIVENCTQKEEKSPRKNSTQKKEETYNTTYWIEEIRLLQQVEELLRKLQAETANSVRKLENEKHNKLIHIREQKLMAEALVHEEKIRAQHSAAEEDLKIKQKHLEQVTLQLRQQHDLVLERLSRVQRHADQIKQQENALMEKEKSLEKKQKSLEEEHRTLAGLRIELQEAAHFLRQEHSDSKTIVELNHLQERCSQLEHELKDAKEQLQTSVYSRADIGTQTAEKFEDVSSNSQGKGFEEQYVTKNKVHASFESLLSSSNEKEGNNQVVLLKRVLNRLQQENSELKAIAAQQRKRIEELTAKAAELANHIAQQKEPSSPKPAERPLNKLPQQQPLDPTFQSPLHTSYGHHTGSTPWFPLDAFSNTAHSPGKDYRRRHPKQYHLNHSGSLSSDDSPTEDVLREAKNRLQKLEEESEAVDRSYRDFRARQADVTTTTPVLGASSQSTSINRPMHPINSSSDRLFLSSSQPITTAFLHSRSFSSPSSTTQGHGFPTSTSLRLTSSRLSSSRLSSRFPARPRTQFTLPERTRHSYPRSENILRVQENVPASDQSFSLIKHKTNTLQNGSEQGLSVLSSGRYSPPQVEMDVKKGDKINQSESQIIQMISKNNPLEIVPQSPLKEKTVESNVDRAGENLLMLNKKLVPLVDNQVISPSESLQPVAVESPERLPLKLNVIDSTLNEISTCSSSVASAIVVSESNAIPHTAIVAIPTTIENVKVYEQSSQLLNTSLSSIENGNLQVSGGSVDRKSGDDDDDDFW
ncbi:uncharacterized protein LOC113215442 [Frankliniella occidentalis]|uniref:Uncharacterized protein LOC113215442 n=1 Tax=Frankliniella occidentalis TaxID=133901 RepID=A0A9C6X978_FRAOC|nr:uncharacterized protein LOC113215442 [Frankliniella occidentalis]